jgi:hypothetical protein
VSHKTESGNSFSVLVAEHEGKRPLKKKKAITDVRITLNSGVNWIHPAQDKDEWRSVINTAMDFRISSYVKN